MTTPPAQVAFSNLNDLRRYANAQTLNTEKPQNDFILQEMFVTAGAEPTAHVHYGEDETFYIQYGEVRFFIGDQVVDAREGMCVFIPFGVAHSFKLLTRHARLTFVHTPCSFALYGNEHYWKEAA